MMYASVAVALLSHAVQAQDNAKDVCPDNVNDGLVTFCQPAEEKGKYGPRHWTLPADQMCGGRVHCLTLDDMKCTDGSRCLKWGKDAYFGRLNVPEGVIVDCFGSWKCSGTAHSTEPGPVVNANHWDYHWREDAFTITIAPGYSCDANRHPPVQRTGVEGNSSYMVSKEMQEMQEMQEASQLDQASNSSPTEEDDLSVGTPTCGQLCADGGHGTTGFISGTAPFCGGVCADCGDGHCYQVEKGSVSDYGHGCTTGSKVCCCSKEMVEGSQTIV